MKIGDNLRTTGIIRSVKTGLVLPREGTFVRVIENLGRRMVLMNFGVAGETYVFPDEIEAVCNDAKKGEG